MKAYKADKVWPPKWPSCCATSFARVRPRAIPLATVTTKTGLHGSRFSMHAQFSYSWLRASALHPVRLCYYFDVGVYRVRFSRLFWTIHVVLSRHITMSLSYLFVSPILHMCHSDADWQNRLKQAHKVFHKLDITDLDRAVRWSITLKY